MHKKTMIFKENSMNKLNALKSTFQYLSNVDLYGYPIHSFFQYEFGCICSEEFNTFKSTLVHNMDNLAKQLNIEVLHEKDSKYALSVIKVQFHKFLQSEVLKPSNYKGEHIRKIFKEYSQMEAQSFTNLLIQNMDSIEKCIVERALHEQEIQKRLKWLNDRKLQIQECKVQEDKAANANSGNIISSGFISDKGNARNIKPSYDIEPMAEVSYTAEYNAFVLETQHTMKPEFLNDTSLMEKVDSDTTPNSSDMCNNEFKDDQSAFVNPHHVNAPGPSRNSSKRVSFQSPKESVGSNDMVHNYYLEETKKKAQLQKDRALNLKPSVITPAILPNTASGSKPKPRNDNQQTRNWPPSMTSRVTNKAVHITEKPKNQKPFLKSKDLACPTCKK
ncbi:hypothetical protein Tco_0737091 [Tanacetum coccineum]